MGDRMKTLIWWIADRVSRLLAPEERTIVMGDLIESDLTGSQALLEIAGLIARRQIEIWKDFGPWLALFGLSGIAGSFLSAITLRFGSAAGMQLHTYWHYGVHYGDGRTPGEDLLFLSGLFIAISLWAWSSGFVLRLLSRRAVWITGTLFCMMVFQGFPEYMMLAGHIIRRGPEMVFLPVLLPGNLVFLIPIWLGIWQARRGQLPHAGTITLLAATVFTLSVMLANVPMAPAPALTLSVCAVASWPLGYMLITTLRRAVAEAS
jgi:hypothetical protein